MEMPEIERSNNDGKPASSHNSDNQGGITLPTPTFRKRLASSTSSELHEESLIQRSTSSDVATPVMKKSKGSDFLPECSEGQITPVSENLETLPAVEEPSDAIADLPQGSNEEAVDAEKDDMETTGEQDEEPKSGGTNQIELQIESNDIVEEIADKQNESEGTTAEADRSKQGSPSVTAETQARQVSSVGKSSTNINLQERAKARYILRQAGTFSPSVGRGRGRAARGSGGRGGRGQSSGGQG